METTHEPACPCCGKDLKSSPHFDPDWYCCEHGLALAIAADAFWTECEIKRLPSRRTPSSKQREGLLRTNHSKLGSDFLKTTGKPIGPVLREAYSRVLDAVFKRLELSEPTGPNYCRVNRNDDGAFVDLGKPNSPMRISFPELYKLLSDDDKLRADKIGEPTFVR